MQGSVEPLGLLVASIRRSVKAMVVRRVEPFGLTPLQFWVLIGVLEAPGSSQAALARRLRCDEPAVSRVVASLVRRGWVVARRQGDDRRRALLVLTPSGRAKARRLAPVAAEVRAEVEVPLAGAELDQVRAALARVASHLARRRDEILSTEATTPPRAPRRRNGAT